MPSTDSRSSTLDSRVAATFHGALPGPSGSRRLSAHADDPKDSARADGRIIDTSRQWTADSEITHRPSLLGPRREGGDQTGSEGLMGRVPAAKANRANAGSDAAPDLAMIAAR